MDNNNLNSRAKELRNRKPANLGILPPPPLVRRFQPVDAAAADVMPPMAAAPVDDMQYQAILAQDPTASWDGIPGLGNPPPPEDFFEMPTMRTGADPRYLTPALAAEIQEKNDPTRPLSLTDYDPNTAKPGGGRKYRSKKRNRKHRKSRKWRKH